MKEVYDLGVQISIVIGGGNIWRGLAASHRGWIARPPTTWGCSPPSSTASPCKVSSSKAASITRVQTAIEMQNVAEPFILRRAVRHLEQGRVVIFVAGTGNPYFSTDTTAACARARSAPTSF